ncbi:MAG: hypothetical protein NTZ13_02460 [Candidatus Parcubacteria bacterium]|nr:hypothetical protein [Candidatus Parcubacteria bacterium]
MMFSINSWVRNHKKDFVALFFFMVVAGGCVLYGFTLPFSVNGDTYVSLLANKASADISYPDREMILRNDFRPYLYPSVLQFFNDRFTPHDYTFIFLFFLVVATGFAGYVALRMLGFSRTVSFVVSLIALPPRSSIGSEIWGVFVPGDTLGRTFGLPVLWLLAAWFIKRKHEKKSLWPVFAVLGLTTYVHPVSIIFFGGMLFLIMLYQIISEKNYREGIKDFAISIVMFGIGASLLLQRIFTTTSRIASKHEGMLPVTSAEYAQAVFSRIRWDFPPASTVWLRVVFIISFVFVAGAIWAYLQICKQKPSKENTLYREIYRFAVPLIIFSAVLSIVLPSLQIWLMREYNWPLILQQGSRMFKYYYLAVFLLFAVALSVYIKKYSPKKYVIALIVIIGMTSSSFGLEWFEFLIGYKNYCDGFIPVALQKKTFAKADTKMYPEICQEMKNAGIKKTDLVLSGDFPLRYFCETKLLATLEEGSSYLMAGKSEMVWWYRTFWQQDAAFNKSEDLIDFAKKQKASYALVTVGSPLEQEFEGKGMIKTKGTVYSVVKF